MAICILAPKTFSQDSTLETPDPSEESTDPSEDQPAIVYPASMASGMLPIVYVNTENGDSILDKVTKIPATLYIDASMTDDFEDLGSPEKPVELTIKGRGNASWEFMKKPYKLKFENKQSPLGMSKSKHYALIAENTNKGIYSFWGFELGKQLGMAWTPSFEPVELILNGNYDGHYLMFESVKIDKNRVNIFEQEEENEDPETIPYGWIVEVDNYSDENQIVITERAGKYLKITHKSPEVLSSAQRKWLGDEFKDILHRLNNDDIYEPTWTQKIDIESFAKYFIISELIGNLDAYTGSFYLHKDMGEDAKWIVGPLWDLDYATTEDDWVFNRRIDENVHFIKEALNFPIFIDEILKVWESITPEFLQKIYDKMYTYWEKTQSALSKDTARWPSLKYSARLSFMTEKLIPTRYLWIKENIMNLYPQEAGIENIKLPEIETDNTNDIYNFQGVLLKKSANQADINSLSPGFYIVGGKKVHIK